MNLEPYIGEIIVGGGVSFVLGVIGAIRGFFVKIKKMENKINKLEADLKDNTRSDADLKNYVNILIEQKLKK